jgi:FADH2-dependent halogenase
MPEATEPTVTEQVDVIVIGAGPGGSVAATRLAQRGHSVLALERREFPRFHIGESLLPSCLVTLDKLGILDRVLAEAYVKKYGGEFSFDFGMHVRFPFSDQGPGRYPHAIQVERARFDHTLLRCARDAGATVLEAANVSDLLIEDGRVTGVTYDHGGRRHTVRSSFVIDAGGRASKVARTFGLRKPIEKLRMVAVFRHFKGLEEANNPGVEGDIQVGAHKEGWVWAIPIRPDTISIGAVMPRDVLKDRDPEQVLTEHLGRAARIAQRATGTYPASDVRVETDYCYYADTITGPGWLMVGDAACFLDPIFSGGVTIAAATGLRAADTVDGMLREPGSEAALGDAYSSFLKTGYDTYARLIYAHYRSRFSIIPTLMEMGVEAPDGDTSHHAEVIRLMCGDFWSKTNELGNRLRERSDMDTFAPFAPDLQCPFYDFA